MAQSGYSSSYRPGVIPSAPPLLDPSADPDMAPPTYEEAIQAPSVAAGGSSSGLSSLLAAAAGGSSSGLPSLLQRDVTPGGTGVLWHPSPAADPRADAEAGAVSSDQRDATVTADSVSPSPAPAPAAGGTGDDPPSYQSLFGHLKEAKQSSSGICEFISKVILTPLECLLGLVLLLLLLGLVFGLPLTLLSVGSLYMYDCPVAAGIPIWMVVGGVVILVYIFWVVCTGEDASTYQSIIGVLFYLAWYIAGCVLIYPVWRPDFYPSYPGDTDYCNYTLMLTAFVIINLLSVLTGVAFCSSSL